MKNESAPDEIATPDLPPRQPTIALRLKRELQWAGGGLAVGLLLLPAAIYAVGTSLLGAYDATSGGTAHIGSFYGDVFRGLAAPSLASWSIVLGPMVIVVLLRLILLPWSGTKPPPARPVEAPVEKPSRREPFVGG